MQTYLRILFILFSFLFFISTNIPCSSVPTRILFVRHGQTALNVQKQPRGHLDVPLNEEGIRQAKTVAQYLKNHEQKIDAIYSSDLPRAQQTAHEIASEFGLKITMTPVLRERFKIDEMESNDFHFCPDILDAWHTKHFKHDESKQDLVERVSFFLKDIVGKHRTIVIVTHGGVIKALAHYCSGEDIKIGNAGVVEFLAYGKVLNKHQECKLSFITVQEFSNP